MVEDRVLDKQQALQQIVQQRYQERLQEQLTDPARLSALYSSSFWSATSNEKLVALCDTAAITIEAPIAEITMVSDVEQKTIASHHSTPKVHSLDLSACQHVIGVGSTLALDNLDEIPVCNFPEIAGRGYKAYLGVPLITRGGYILGALCVADYVAREWSDVDVNLLSYLASAIMAMHEAEAVT